MKDMLVFVSVWAAGMLLGALFYGGLWWTVRKIASSPWPALWVLGSLLLRMSAAVAGFYLVAGSHWERLLLCLLGFIMARALVAWLTRPPTAQSQPAQEVPHAP